MSQLESLLRGVRDAKTSVDQKLTQQEEEKQELIKKRQDQIHLQQQYFTLLNKLNDSVKKNETLNMKLKYN